MKQFVFHFLCFLAFPCGFSVFFMSKKFLHYNKKCAILDVVTQPALAHFWKEGKVPLRAYYTMTREDLQALRPEDIFLPEQELSDKDSRGKERDWRGKKMRNELLANAYHEIDVKKESRLRECGKVLTYRVYEDGTKQLDSMTSCRVRLCPICTWRRSLKIYSQTREIVDEIARRYGFRWVMLTLTVKSVESSQLSAALDLLMDGWNRLIRLKAVQGICKGWYRSLEIVHDCAPFITPEMWDGCPEKHIKSRKTWYKSHGYSVGDPNPTYNLYHPHIHALICVVPSYFSGRSYIKQADWAEMWGKALRVDYVPRVDIRSVKGATMEEISSAVCEVAKYAAKDSDYIIPDDWDLTVETVRTLDSAIDGRRLVAYGGIMRLIKRELGQDDAEDGSLVHVGDEELKDGKYKLVSYWWYSGYRQYYSV